MAGKNNVRVRLAPSPTGEVHIGTIWVALFDWLFAKQHDGDFVLRIEDTDQKRLVPGTMERLNQALTWFGLEPSEGPQSPGQFGPYIQSQRLPLYTRHARQLIEQGSAYYCFCSPDRLEKLRLEQAAAKLPPRYDKLCSAIPPSEAASRVSGGEPAVVRLNMPTTGTIVLEDIIRGQVTFRFDQVDDSVLLKTDGFPTYHLAVVVDDHLMEISHVIRAEEWLPSAPKHLYLYQQFGWTPPHFAHIPQILGTNKKKLSKREAAASALSFRDQGYLPETMINFLALMGWHPKGESEILSRQDLLDQFRLADINPSGAVFDQTKLDWLNGYYIRQLPPEELLKRLKPFWHIPTGLAPSPDWQLQALALIRDRLRTLAEVDGLVNFAFPSVWDDDLSTLGTLVSVNDLPSLAWIRSWLDARPEPWNAAELKSAALRAIKEAGKKNGHVLSPLRQVLSLKKASPDVFDILALIGKQESVRRIDAAHVAISGQKRGPKKV